MYLITFLLKCWDLSMCHRWDLDLCMGKQWGFMCRDLSMSASDSDQFSEVRWASRGDIALQINEVAVS